MRNLKIVVVRGVRLKPVVPTKLDEASASYLVYFYHLVECSSVAGLAQTSFTFSVRIRHFCDYRLLLGEMHT